MGGGGLRGSNELIDQNVYKDSLHSVYKDSLHSVRGQGR